MQTPNVPPAAKAKGRGVRGEKSSGVQCWLPTSWVNGSRTRGRLPEPRLASTHPALGLVEIIGVLCHPSGISLFALLWKALWDWPMEGTGGELGGTGWLFDFCATEEIYPTTVKFTDFWSRERILLFDGFEELRPNSSSLYPR